MSQFNKNKILISLIFTFSLFYITFYIPITYDEAWNYLNISSKGFYYSITNYPFPNNHVLFSFIQSFLINNNILQISPNLLRLGNLIIVFFFILFILKIFKYYQINNKKNILLYILFLIFSSQLVTTYFLVSRGYLLGTYLSLMGIFYWGVRNNRKGLLFLAFSAWTVPTYSFIWPGLFIYKFIQNKKITHSLLDGLLLSLATLILYLPIINQVTTNRDKWSTFPNLKSFYTASLITFNNFNNIYVSIIILTFIVIFTILNKKYKIQKFNYILLSSIISYVGTITLFSLFNISNIPFIRNGVFIPFFLMLQLIFLAESIKKNIVKNILYFLLFINTFVGISSLFKYILYKNNYETINILSPTALISAKKDQLNNSKIITYNSWTAEPVAKLYGNIYNLEIQNIKNDYNTCNIGKILPFSNEKITLIGKNNIKTSLCY